MKAREANAAGGFMRSESEATAALAELIDHHVENICIYS